MRITLDTHTHTLVSGHAYSTITEMARAASEKGLELLGITEHAEKMPGSCKNIYFTNLKILPRKMFGIYVLFGAEANITSYRGDLDVSERILTALDLVVASLHLPCLSPGSCQENTQALLGAMKNPYVTCIGHPDDGRYPLDYEAVVLAARENHVLLELNNHSLAPDTARQNGRENDRTMLRLCKRHQVPIIIGSDAHWAGAVGECSSALALLEEEAFPQELVVNTSLDSFLAYLPEIAKKRMGLERESGISGREPDFVRDCEAGENTNTAFEPSRQVET